MPKDLQRNFNVNMITSDKIFPQALDSERVMLGSVLLNNDCMLDVTAITSPAEWLKKQGHEFQNKNGNYIAILST